MQGRMMKSAKTAACAILAAILALMVLIAQGDAAYAAKENSNVPDITRSKSSFTLQVNYTDDEVTTPIDGVTLTVYKIAGVRVSGGRANYPVEDPYKGLGFNFTNMTADDATTYAEKAAQVVQKDGLSGKSATSNGSGAAAFGELENGIYLVMQTGASGSAKKYSQFAPWIVELPELSESETGTKSWNYNVTSYPKPFVGSTEEDTPQQTSEPEEELEGGNGEKQDKYRTEDDELEEETEKKEKNHDSPIERLVRTGDESSIGILAGIAMISLGLLLVVVSKRRRSQK